MTWLPFDLHPDYPPHGVLRRTLENRYGRGFLAHVGKVVEAAGFTHAPPDRVPRSLASLELGELARGAGAHDRVHRRLFSAYWSEGRDIGDTGVLVAVAEESGLDPDEAREALASGSFREQVRASSEAARQAGVEAVPAWLIDRQMLVVGSQPHEVFAKVLEDLGHRPVDGSQA